MTERFSAGGATLVKLFGRPEAEADEFGDRADRVRAIGVRTAMANRVFMTSLTLVSALAQAMVYGVGGWLAITGRIDAGTVVSLALLLTRLYGPLTQLANARVDVMSALVSFERVFEVLDLPPTIVERADPTPLPRGRAGRGAAARRALHLPERPPQSRWPAWRRSRPSTTSTTPRCCTGSTSRSGRADAGARRALRRGQVDDRLAGAAALRRRLRWRSSVGGYGDVWTDVDLSFADLRAAVGVVTQDGHLFHDTVAANLRYAKPDATDAELVTALERARLGPLVRQLPEGLETVVGERGYRLSGGERQRLTIARLLLAAPRVVILDEATAHLDSESEVAVQEALTEALVGRTAIVIAHRLSTIRSADTIAVVEDGRVVEQGPHEVLLDHGGRYADLHHTQFAPAA